MSIFECPIRTVVKEDFGVSVRGSKQVLVSNGHD